MKEIWKDVIGFEPYYKVSNKGEVFSMRKNSILPGYTDKDGYLRVSLQGATKNKKIMAIHRIVALAFIPNPERKPEVNHKDFNRKNNCSTNLEWATRKENTKYSLANYKKGETHYKSFLKNTQVARIKKLRSLGLRYREIAKIYDIDIHTCINIIKRDSYK